MRILEVCLDCEEEEEDPPVFVDSLGLLDDIFVLVLVLVSVLVRETKAKINDLFSYINIDIQLSLNTND